MLEQWLEAKEEALMGGREGRSIIIRAVLCVISCAVSAPAFDVLQYLLCRDHRLCLTIELCCARFDLAPFLFMTGMHALCHVGN